MGFGSGWRSSYGLSRKIPCATFGRFSPQRPQFEGPPLFRRGRVWPHQPGGRLRRHQPLLRPRHPGACSPSGVLRRVWVRTETAWLTPHSYVFHTRRRCERQRIRLPGRLRSTPKAVQPGRMGQGSAYAGSSSALWRRRGRRPPAYPDNRRCPSSGSGGPQRGPALGELRTSTCQVISDFGRPEGVQMPSIGASGSNDSSPTPAARPPHTAAGRGRGSSDSTPAAAARAAAAPRARRGGPWTWSDARYPPL